jgi:hypothetical protein
VRFMNCRGDDEVDAKRFETVDRKTRFGSREQRARAVDWGRSADHIRARSQNGCIQRPDTWPHPNDFAEASDFFPMHRGRRPTWTHKRHARVLSRLAFTALSRDVVLAQLVVILSLCAR